MRPALLRACTLSFCTRAASNLAPCLAPASERYLECRNPQTFTCHQPARSTTSILIFIAGLLCVRRDTGRRVRGLRSKLTPSGEDRELVKGRPSGRPKHCPDDANPIESRPVRICVMQESQGSA